MIQVLNNPCTINYHNFRNIVLDYNFDWHWQQSTYANESDTPGHIHMPFYGHTFLVRPEDSGFTQVGSKYHIACRDVLSEIINSNNLFHKYFFLRAAANCIHPDEGIQISEPHIDHDFQHYNLLVYLEGDGDTIVEGERYSPKNHDVILFQGSHYMTRPTRGRRVVLICTLFEIPKK